jgi:speckle-type POZ protein
VQFSHDLTINGHSETNCYIFGNGTFMKSDKFVAGGRRWYLRYYPNGCNSDDWRHVTFLLYHDRGAEEDKVPEVLYNVSLLGPDGNPLQGYPRFSRNYQVTYDDEPSFGGLISRSELERSACVRDDAFSVRCEFRVPTVVAKTVLLPTEETPPSSPTPTHVPADVHERLIRVFFDDMPTDEVLEVGDETFPAHKSEGFENCFGQLMIEYPSVVVELLARVSPSPR